MTCTLALCLSAAQVFNLNMAYNEGSYYGIGRTFQAVVLVESSACLHKRGDDNTSLGCSQLKLDTARKVCRCNISKRALLGSNATNLRIGAQYLANCFNQFWPDEQRALICYNEGPYRAAKASVNQVSKSQYVAKVKSYLKLLQQLPLDTE